MRDFKLNVSELLENAKAPFGVSKELESIDIFLDDKVSEITFYPWLREVGNEVFEELANSYEDFHKQHGIPCLKVFRSLSSQFFSIEFQKID